MNYVVDIDGTICSQTLNNEYHLAQPFKERIEKINKLYDQGHTIVYFTARGMTRFNGSIDRVYEAFYYLTKDQLDSWGAKYHKLVLGKQPGDIYIDDKGINSDNFFND